MKNISFSLITFFLVTTFISCTASRESNSSIKNDMRDARLPGRDCFVVLQDGTTKNYADLKLVTGLFTNPHLLADGVTRIKPQEIIAYQNQNHYAISQEIFMSGRRSKVAIETLPGFAIRIACGEVNVYNKKFYNGICAVDEYFIQDGDEGAIIEYTAESMNSLVQYNPQALEFFIRKKYTTPKTRKHPVASNQAKNNFTSLRR